MNYLPGNLKVLRKKLALTQAGLAEQIGVNRSAIGAYEEGRADPRVQTLIRMGVFFKVSVDDLLNKDLSAQEPKAYVADQLRVLPVIVDRSTDREVIPLIPQKAAAGYLSNYSDPEFIADQQGFVMPYPQLTADRTYRIFQIGGESMLPVPDGAYIIAQYVSSLSEVREGACYVLTTREEGIVYKRVLSIGGNTLTLSSDNPEYESFAVAGSDVLEIWQALGFTSFDLPGPDAYQPELSEISLALKALQQQIGAPESPKEDSKTKKKKKKKSKN